VDRFPALANTLRSTAVNTSAATALIWSSVTWFMGFSSLVANIYPLQFGPTDKRQNLLGHLVANPEQELLPPFMILECVFDLVANVTPEFLMKDIPDVLIPVRINQTA
jgi:hypothetical protein